MRLLKEIKQKVIDRYYLHKYIFPFIKRNEGREVNDSNCLCLFSFPRSGSTWLTEILLTIPNSCLFDEPLLRNKILSPNDLPNYNDRKIKEIADLSFWFYQPLPGNLDNDDIKKLFRNIICGRSLSIGLYNDYGLKKLATANYFITKFNYGFLLSTWFKNNFHINSLYLIRSPYACIASMLRHPFYNKLTIPNIVSIPDFKYNDVYKFHKDKYESIKSIEEFYTFLWCINYKEGFDKNKGKEIFHVYYEDLVLNYERKVREIFNFINVNVPLGYHALKNKPSLSTQRESKINILNNTQLNAWKTILTQKQKNNIKDILDYFEISEYQAESVPNHINN